MISRQNRAPTGRTSNRPSTQSALSSARSMGSLPSGRLNSTDSPKNSLLSPIKRPGSKMSQSGAWSLPPTDRVSGRDSDTVRGGGGSDYGSARSGTSSSRFQVTSSRQVKSMFMNLNLISVCLSTMMKLAVLLCLSTKLVLAESESVHI